jgi:hypothetical protein
MQVTTLTVVPVLIIIILTIAAIKTVIPNSEVSKTCLIGYKAACSFTPISTIVLILIAFAIFAAAKRMTWI